jgi:hypothetical protein
MSELKYKRNCPKCGKVLETKNKYYFKKAVKEEKLCGSCSLAGREFSLEHRENLRKNHADVSGENNPFYKKNHSDDVKKKISKIVSEKYKDSELRKKVSEIRKEWHTNNDNPFKGKFHSDETKNLLSFLTKVRMQDVEEREKISKSLIGNEPWNKGKTDVYTNEQLKKFSESAKRRIIKQGNGQIHSYNPKSIPIIENYGKESGYNFIHAENGGEYQIPNTTFFVDGYDKSNNVVIEFDEKHHLIEKQKIKDIQRQDMIGQLLKCKFIRIDENNNINIFDYSL